MRVFASLKLSYEFMSDNIEPIAHKYNTVVDLLRVDGSYMWAGYELKRFEIIRYLDKAQQAKRQGERGNYDKTVKITP